MAASATFSRSWVATSSISRQHLISKSLHPLCAAKLQSTTSTQPCRHNCNRAGVTRINKDEYLRMYPTTLVLKDGSSIRIRYKEPRLIIKMPVDTSKLTPEEIHMRKMKMNPVTKLKIKDELEDTYDPNTYMNYLQ